MAKILDNKKKKILLVDDDEISMGIAAVVLQEKFEITTAQSGKIALEILAKDYKPDLILLDIIMPEMSGWEAFKKMRENELLNDVPIAFLTSLMPIEGLEQSKNIGAADYITKPIDKDELPNRIEKLFKKRRL